MDAGRQYSCGCGSRQASYGVYTVAMNYDLPHRNCYRVAPQLIAGEYPGAAEPTKAAARIARHLEAGISYFLDLTEAGELAPYAALLAQAAAACGQPAIHTRLPIRDVSVPETPAAMQAILDTLDNAMAAGHSVYLHCWGGVGRTGTVVGCWLVRHGQTGEQALATLTRHWCTVEKAYRHPRSPETVAQQAYVRNWR
jgi:protein-tyrosine phosphatase